MRFINKLALILLASFALASVANAHCGSCGAGEKHEEKAHKHEHKDHKHEHKSCDEHKEGECDCKKAEAPAEKKAEAPAEEKAEEADKK
jgi:Ni/Co efflux regulator RcnB